MKFNKEVLGFIPDAKLVDIDDEQNLAMSIKLMRKYKIQKTPSLLLKQGDTINIFTTIDELKSWMKSNTTLDSRQ